jgi:hypothetical protein
MWVMSIQSVYTFFGHTQTHIFTFLIITRLEYVTVPSEVCCFKDVIADNILIHCEWSRQWWYVAFSHHAQLPCMSVNWIIMASCTWYKIFKYSCFPFSLSAAKNYGMRRPYERAFSPNIKKSLHLSCVREECRLRLSKTDESIWM